MSKSDPFGFDMSVSTSKKKNRENLTGQISGWKSILNTLSVHYGDRIADHI